MFELVRDRRLGVMAFSPLGIGLLTELYAPGGNPPTGSFWGSEERDAFPLALSGDAATSWDTVREIATDRGKSMAQVAVNWVLSHPEITVAVSGSETIDQLDHNLGAVGWELSEEELARLNEVSARVTTPYWTYFA